MSLLYFICNHEKEECFFLGSGRISELIGKEITDVRELTDHEIIELLFDMAIDEAKEKGSAPELQMLTISRESSYPKFFADKFSEWVGETPSNQFSIESAPEPKKLTQSTLSVTPYPITGHRYRDLC